MWCSGRIFLGQRWFTHLQLSLPEFLFWHCGSGMPLIMLAEAFQPRREGAVVLHMGSVKRERWSGNELQTYLIHCALWCAMKMTASRRGEWTGNRNTCTFEMTSSHHGCTSFWHSQRDCLLPLPLSPPTQEVAPQETGWLEPALVRLIMRESCVCLWPTPTINYKEALLLLLLALERTQAWKRKRAL